VFAFGGLNGARGLGVKFTKMSFTFPFYFSFTSLSVYLYLYIILKSSLFSFYLFKKNGKVFMLQKKSPQIGIEFIDNEVSEMFSIYICILYFTWM